MARKNLIYNQIDSILLEYNYFLGGMRAAAEIELCGAFVAHFERQYD